MRARTFGDRSQFKIATLSRAGSTGGRHRGQHTDGLCSLTFDQPCLSLVHIALTLLQLRYLYVLCAVSKDMVGAVMNCACLWITI